MTPVRFLSVKRSVYILVTLLSIQGVLSQTWVMYVTENPAAPRRCYDNSTGESHAVGEQWTPPDVCIRLSCDEEGHELLIAGIGCGSVEDAKPPCWRVPPNVSLPFPDCCPRVVCN
ncbi:U-scoloptoxin(16)-Cw1a [Anabrus simplex]|uniref:U-scoloptoxin(16)-Cw1a n=1 Tax=Anabrus simplex TaxID=316456 RepID=UPI0034DDAB01